MTSAQDIFIDANDALYVSDTLNQRIQQYLPNTVNANTVAGVTGVTGTATNTSLLNQPRALFIDSNKYMYIADTGHCRLLKWSVGASSGTILSGPGLLPLCGIYDIFVDNSGNIYAATVSYGQILKWASSATNYTIIAGSTINGWSSADLYNPFGFTVDTETNTLYIANTQANTIVTWLSHATTGTIILGQNATSGAAKFLLNSPTAIIRDSNKNLYVADYGNNRIILFCQNPPNSTGIPIIEETLYYPLSIAFDSKLNLYVLESNAYRVKKFARIT